MNPQSSHFLEKLKESFGKEDYADSIIDIIEVDKPITPSSNRRLSRKRKAKESSSSLDHSEQLYCTLSVHCNILALQSEYFQKMFESSMKESKTKELKLKVETGEGQYVKLFLQGFYDHNVFKGMKPYELLRTIEIADRYACDTIIQQAAHHLETLDMHGIAECENLTYRVARVNYGLEIMKTTAQSLVNKCASRITALFCPLETKIFTEEEKFKNLSFELLLAVLRCRKQITYHENSVLYYVISWLEFKESRQTQENIEMLLEEINYSEMTPEFLLDVITEKHVILNKWKGYKDWFIFAIGYHAQTIKGPCLGVIGKSSNIYFNRNFDDKNKPMVFKFQYRKSPTDEEFSSDRCCFVYRGYEIVTLIEFVDSNTPDVKIILLNMYLGNLREFEEQPLLCNEIFDITIAVSIQPGNLHDLTDEKVLNFSKFSSKECMSEVYSFCYDHSPLSVGKIDKQCIEKWRSVDLFLAVRNKDTNWPNTFPRHLKTSNGERLEITYDPFVELLL